MSTVARCFLIAVLLLFTQDSLSQLAESFPPTDVVINAGGATFPQEIYSAWFKEYRDRFDSPEILSYVPTGSSIGIQWIKGQMQPRSLYPFPIVFAGSDSQLQSADYQQFPELQMFPTVAGAIVVVFNLPGSGSLNLSREAIVDIFSGNISMWNDPILVELNPTITLPSKPIKLIVRRDGSGSSEVFTRGLSVFTDEWKYGVIKDPKLISPEGPSSVWPAAVRYFGMGNNGINGLLSSIPYSISYAGVAEAVDGNFNIATIRNKAGNYIHPSDISKGVQTAMDYYAGQMDDRLTVHLIDAPVADAYPFAMYTYIIVNMSTHQEIPCGKVKLFVKVLQWTHNSAQADQLAYGMDLVPLSKPMAAKIKEKVIKNIMCQGRNVLEWIEADDLALAALNQFPTFKVIAGVVVVVIIIIAVLLGGYHYRRRRVMAKEWLIPPSSIQDKDPAWRTAELRAPSVLTSSTSTSGLSAAFCNDDSFPAFKGFTAFMNDTSVLCFEAIVSKEPGKFKFKTSARLAVHCRQMHHRNVAQLMGIAAHHDGEKYWFDDGIYHIYEDPGKTTLHSILATCPYRLNHGVMCSLALDVCNGMRFLARKGIIHGQLSTFNCILDNNWTVRICNWSQTTVTLDEHLTASEIADGIIKRNTLFLAKNEEPIKRLLYTHPDILRGKITLTQLTQEHDLYSFAMTLGEIFTREIPYTEVGTMIGWKSTLLAILDGQSFPSCRPTIPQPIFELIKRLASAKWAASVGTTSYDAALHILENAAKVGNGSHRTKGIVDSLLNEMELYVGKLESKMEDRAAGLKELNHRTKSILDSFIPNSIATILQAGRQAPPELYKNATVCYLRYCFIGRQTNSTTPNVPTAEEHMTLFETFESLAVTNPLGVKIITLTDKSVLLMSGHDGKASHADAALSTVKFSLLIANSLRGRTTQVNIGISSGAVCGFLAGSQGQRFIVLGDTVDRAKELSSYAPPSTVRLSSTTYGLVRALLQHNKIDVVLETHGSHETYIAKFS